MSDLLYGFLACLAAGVGFGVFVNFFSKYELRRRSLKDDNQTAGAPEGGFRFPEVD